MNKFTPDEDVGKDLTLEEISLRAVELADRVERLLAREPLVVAIAAVSMAVGTLGGHPPGCDPDSPCPHNSSRQQLAGRVFESIVNRLRMDSKEVLLLCSGIIGGVAFQLKEKFDTLYARLEEAERKFN